MSTQENPGEAHPLRSLEVEFEVIRELGRGGSSVVYLAVERELEREVAIKTIHPLFAADVDAAARLEREARTLARLQHPNIVTFYGIRRLADGSLAVVMQYVRGERLKDRIRSQGPMAFEEVRSVLADVARALAHAHRHHVVHRDIKPENIYLDSDLGIARLSDFGIARAWDRDGSLTQAGLAIGTPAYMAPEQIDGAGLDGRSDLYSLGLVGYEMLTGERPWNGQNLYGIIYRQKHEWLPPIETVRPDIPAGLQAAIRRSLEKDPELRWPSAEALLECLAGDAGAAGAERALLTPVAAAPSPEPPPALAAPLEPSPVPLPDEALTIPYRPADQRPDEEAERPVEPVPAPAAALEGDAALLAQLEWGLRSAPARDDDDDAAPPTAASQLRGRRRRTVVIAAVLALALAGSVSAISILRRHSAVPLQRATAQPSPLRRLAERAAVEPVYSATIPVAGPVDTAAAVAHPDSARPAAHAPAKHEVKPLVLPPPPPMPPLPVDTASEASAVPAPPRILGRPMAAPGSRPADSARHPQPPREPAPAPPRATVVDADAAPVFVPFEVAPQLRNRDDVRRALGRYYPSGGRDSNVGGHVVVWIYVDTLGAVRKAQVKQSSGFTPLDRAALQVAGIMKFAPALNRDRRVGVWVAVPIDFSAR